MQSRKCRTYRVSLVLTLCATVLTLGQSGCTTSVSEFIHNGFKVGPNYTPPPTPVPAQWIDEDNPRVKIGDPNLATWWAVFDDPILNGLIERSCAGNLTLRAAGYQILQAEQARNIAVGELFPQSQALNASMTRAQASANGGAAVSSGVNAGAGLAPGATLVPVAGGVATTTPTNPSISSGIGGATGVGGSAGGGRFFSNNATSLNASWEVDFWGLFRRNLESSNGVLDQSVQNYDQAVVLLYANVATQYVQIRTLQRRLELARKNVALQEPLVNALQKRFQEKAASAEIGYFQLKSNLDNTRALIPQLTTQLRQANNQLCILLGMPVRDLLPELGDGKAPSPQDAKMSRVLIPVPKDEAVVVGIEADLLLRRPDVQAAESQLKIQSAQIGIAEAEMYPHIGINGTIGLAASSFNQVLSKYSWTGSIGPSMTWNILNYGRLLANVRLQNYQYQQFVAQYQNAVLIANQDAENAMVAYLQSLDQAKNLHDSAASAARVTELYQLQFGTGFVPKGQDSGAVYNQLFTTINFLVSQEDAAAQAEGNIALNLILLYKAMGGGWQNGNCRPNVHRRPDDFQMSTAASSAIPSSRPAFGVPAPLEAMPPTK